jgi:hypothetical protein
MKTKIYLGLSITAVCLMMACNSSTTNKPEGIMTDSVSNHPTQVTELNSKFIMPVADIKQMVAKYKQERVDIAGNSSNLLKGYGPDFKDSRCVWFSIEDLKEFIKAAESQPTKADGIRMYYTVYPEKKEGESAYLSSIPAESRNHMTLVLVPTFYDSKTQSHPDFQPLPSKENIEGQNQSVAEEGAKAAAAPAQQASSIMAMNHGGLCPPNCPSAGSGSSFIDN